jgi:hypothetical protein
MSLKAPRKACTTSSVASISLARACEPCVAFVHLLTQGKSRLIFPFFPFPDDTVGGPHSFWPSFFLFIIVRVVESLYGEFVACLTVKKRREKRREKREKRRQQRWL